MHSAVDQFKREGSFIGVVIQEKGGYTIVGKI
jgi:hypothetical protein